MIRRPIAVLLAAMLAVVATGPRSPALAGTSVASHAAGITLDPVCAPVWGGDIEFPATLTIGVRGYGFDPLAPVDVSSGDNAGEPGAPVLASAQTDEFGTFGTSIDMSWPIGNGAVLVAAVSFGDLSESGTRGFAYLEVPCRQQVSVTPTCGQSSDGGPYVLSGLAQGFAPKLPVEIFLEDTSDGQVIDSILLAEGTPGRDGSLPFDGVQVGPLPDAVYRVVAQQGRTEQRAETYFEVPCEAPTLTLDPESCAPSGSPPGRYDIGVVGTGFRASSSVIITWDPGGTNEVFYGIEVSKAGRFSARIDPYQRQKARELVISVYDFEEVQPDLIVTTTIRIPCHERQQPTLSADPDCGPPALLGDPERRLDITLHATGFDPGHEVRFVFDADQAALDVVDPETFQEDADEQGNVDLPIDPLARPAGTYRILAIQDDVEPPLQASTVFRMPCRQPNAFLRPLLERDCGPILPDVPEAYPVLVRARGFVPGNVEITFDADGSPEVFAAVVGPDGRFAQSITPSGRSRGVYRILASQSDARGELAQASRDFIVPCLEPTLTITPRVGPAGFTCFVKGADFPPNSSVTLTWNRGIRAGTPILVQADGDGAFSIPIFILPHDQAGTRRLTAGAPDDPNAYPRATADYLVVAGTGMPFPRPDSTDPPIIIRR